MDPGKVERSYRDAVSCGNIEQMPETKAVWIDLFVPFSRMYLL